MPAQWISRLAMTALMAEFFLLGCAGSKVSSPVPAKPVAIEPSYALQFKAKPGASATYRIKLQNRFTQEAMGQENAVDAGWQAVLTQRVETPEAAADFIVTIHFDSVVVEVGNPALEPLLKPIEGIAGKSVQVALSPVGEIKKLYGLENLPAAANQNNQMETTLRNMFPRFAGYATKVGGRWTRHDTTSNQSDDADLQIINHSQYVLLSANQVAGAVHFKLHNSGSFSLSGTTQNQGMEVGLSGAGSTEADFTVDDVDGWLISASAITESSGTAELKAEPPMLIPWRSSSRVTIVRK
jgi:hypothetical protein